MFQPAAAAAAVLTFPSTALRNRLLTLWSAADGGETTSTF
jgi:hypothetical protein